ncbi:unnamed protein product [Ambrosiozyma monospora]|uniref:Unnamed protein product n=1 Tax=Ambrosiozyma monospora TaxID=43982 RepID=A0A9W6YZE7_AMBMO|nr:unnamed protein product [Ambrosiozyma monospora]
MSHQCHDEHVHGHGDGHGGHGHSHQHEAAPIPTSTSQSLNSKINTANLEAFNLANPQTDLAELFKSHDKRYELIPVIKSDADNQLIIKIPFAGVTTKLYSVILRTSKLGDHCPKAVKFYKNQDNLDFDSIGSQKPTYVVEHPEIGVEDGEGDELTELVDDNTFAEHFLPRHLFSAVNTLTIFFENNWTDDDDEVLHLYSIEIRGEFKELTKDPIITLYESAANPADHKNMLPEETKNFHNV